MTESKTIKNLSKAERQKLVKSQQRAILQATELIECRMADLGISNRELARRIDVTPPYITKILKGENNFTLTKLSEIFFVLGCALRITLTNSDEPIQVFDTSSIDKSECRIGDENTPANTNLALAA